MCGIGGIFNLQEGKLQNLSDSLLLINKTQKHRGPDGDNIYFSKNEICGLAHVRLGILDLKNGEQPLKIGNHIITFNGELYNYAEIKDRINNEFTFKTKTDTEVLLNLYIKHQSECINYIKGMFSFAIYNENENTLFCSRDRFGIKPFYYTIQNNIFYFASEIKALLPFVKDKKIDINALQDYLSFQYVIGDKTLFDGIKQLMPAHTLQIKNNKIVIKKYWEIQYEPDVYHTKKYYIETLRELFHESIKLQLGNEDNIGAYVSGGIDSSITAILAARERNKIKGFHGRFTDFPGYDESIYAKELIQHGIDLNIVDITSLDFIENIESAIYYMDYPEAGPGLFPQYIMAKKASSQVKILIGGQGGDEMFGGYVRYLIAYFEQCIKGAINGTLNNGKFVVTYESIIPSLTKLKQYMPMLKDFWTTGLFDSKDSRYYNLINRFKSIEPLINWNNFNTNYNIFEEYKKIYHADNLTNASYFDEMTHYDFKSSLPALLHVEDRVNSAFGIESRVPFLDYELFEFSATVPSNIKFEDGKLKNLLIEAFKPDLPEKIYNRTDKMGFPVPLNEWFKTDKKIKEFIFDTFSKSNRFYLKNGALDLILKSDSNTYNRNLWGMLCLELWQQKFID